jgi:hypothetical protein
MYFFTSLEHYWLNSNKSPDKLCAQLKCQDAEGTSEALGMQSLSGHLRPALPWEVRQRETSSSVPDTGFCGTRSRCEQPVAQSASSRATRNAFCVYPLAERPISSIRRLTACLARRSPDDAHLVQNHCP